MSNFRVAEPRTRRTTLAVAPVPWWRSYWLLLSAAYRAQIQYRSNVLLTIAGGAVFQTVGLLFVSIVVTRFGAIGGWSMAEISFLYGMRLVAHSLWMVPCAPLSELDSALRNNTFDRHLIRPCGVLLQVFTRQFYLATLGDLVTGVSILVASASQLSIKWSLSTACFLLAALVGGALVEGACQLAASAMSFRALSSQALRGLIDQVFNGFGGYPLSIFPRATQLVFTFVLPLAFVAYFPATLILGRRDDLVVPHWVAAASPFVGAILVFLSYLLWLRQLQHYSSSGT